MCKLHYYVSCYFCIKIKNHSVWQVCNNRGHLHGSNTFSMHYTNTQSTSQQDTTPPHSVDISIPGNVTYSYSQGNKAIILSFLNLIFILLYYVTVIAALGLLDKGAQKLHIHCINPVNDALSSSRALYKMNIALATETLIYVQRILYINNGV